MLSRRGVQFFSRSCAQLTRGTSPRFLKSGNVNTILANAARCLSSESSQTQLKGSAKYFDPNYFELQEDEDLPDSYYDRERIPIVPEKVIYHEATKHLHDIPNKKLLEEVNFERDFEVKTFSTIHELQHGSYVNLDALTIDKYLPEGFGGDLYKEFEYTRRTTWMIRPATKFLCRLIEEFDQLESKIPGSSGERWTPPPVEKKPFEYRGFTDRPAWGLSKHDIRYYNTDIVKAVENKKLADAESGILPGVEQLGTEVESWLDQLRSLSGDKGLPKEILLTGERGSGKSAVLSQAVLYARQRGWLCFYIPKGWDYVQSGDYVQPIFTKADGTVVFDNPQMSAQVLRGFYKAHAALLQTIPIRDVKAVTAKYNNDLDKFKKEAERLARFSGRKDLTFLKMREMIEDEEAHREQDALDKDVLKDFDYMNFEVRTLADLCLMGIAFRSYAGLAAVDIITELKELTSVPVLFAVDHWNQWEVPSAFSYGSEDVQSKQLCIPHSLQFVSRKRETADKWHLKNGICIGALSFRHLENGSRRVNYHGEESSVPLTLRVPLYDATEFVAASAYYQAANCMGRMSNTQELLAFRTMVGSVPYKFREDLPMYWVPVEASKMSGNIFSPDFYSGDDENPYPNRYLLDLDERNLPHVEGGGDDDDDYDAPDVPAPGTEGAADAGAGAGGKAGAKGGKKAPPRKK